MSTVIATKTVYNQFYRRERDPFIAKHFNQSTCTVNWIYGMMLEIAYCGFRGLGKQSISVFGKETNRALALIRVLQL